MRIPSASCQRLRLSRIGRWRLTDYGATDIAIALGETACKAIGPATQPWGLWDDLQLVLVIRDNLSKLILNVVRLNGLPTDSGQSLGGRLEFAFLDKVTWGLGEEE